MLTYPSCIMLAGALRNQSRRRRQAIRLPNQYGRGFRYIQGKGSVFMVRQPLAIWASRHVAIGANRLYDGWGRNVRDSERKP
jgi:hypothetical protein